MAMRFSQAQRAENPDLAQALAMQTQQANALKGAEMQADAQNRASNLQGGAMLAQAAPEGTFSNAWDTFNQPSEAGMLSDFSGAGTGAEALTGDAIAANLGADATAGLGADALSAEGLMAGFAEGGGAAGAALGGGEAALGAEALAASMAAPTAGAAATGAAAGGAAAGGAAPALAAMGPMGWVALAALGSGLFG